MDVSRSNDNAAFRVGGLTVLRRYFRERRSRRAGGDARSHTIRGRRYLRFSTALAAFTM
jgi:hypothetical protein